MSRTVQNTSRWLVAIVLLTLGCNSGETNTSDKKNGASTPKTENVTSDGLKTLFTTLQDAIRANDTATVVTMTKGLFPDETSLQKAIKDPAAITKIKPMHAQFSDASDEQIAGVFATDPNRTEIIVHSATTEEIVAYEKGGTAYAEFPGGAKTAAESVLQPNTTFYEVELVEPGQDLGMKYHLFYHDGKNWKMLGPIWRVLR